MTWPVDYDWLPQPTTRRDW